MREKESEKVFGYLPKDFMIFRQLNKIDDLGIKQDLTHPSSHIAHDKEQDFSPLFQQ